MDLFVYALCAATSLVCFGLLLRQNLQESSPLVLKSSIGFLCFALANVLLFIDLIVLPQIDLILWRNVISLAGVIVLLVALTDNNRG